MAWWSEVEEEARIIQQRQRRRQRRRAARDTTPRTVVDNLVRGRRRAPWVPVGVLAPVVRSGVTPESPQFTQISDHFLMEKARTGQWANPGEEPNEAALLAAQRAGRNRGLLPRDLADTIAEASEVAPPTAPAAPKVEATDDFGVQSNPADDALFWLARYGSKVGFKKANKDITDAITHLSSQPPRPRIDTPYAPGPDVPVAFLFQKIVEAQGAPAFNYPGTKAEGEDEYVTLIQAVANAKGLKGKQKDYAKQLRTEAQVENFDWTAWAVEPLVRFEFGAPGKILEASTGLSPFAGSSGDVNVSIPKPVSMAASRGFMLAMQYPMDMVNAANRRIARGEGWNSGVGNPFDPQGWVDAPVEFLVEANEQSAGGQALKAFVQGDEVDVGSGWIPDIRSGTWQKAAQAARDESPVLYGGSAWTPGRFIANQIDDPNKFWFDVISGAVDAAITIKFDPSIIAFTKYNKAVTEGRKVAITNTPEGQAFLSAEIGRRQADDVFQAAQKRAERATARQAEIAPNLQGSVFDLNYASEQNAINEALRLRDEAQATLTAARGSEDEALAILKESAGAYGRGHRLQTKPQKFMDWVTSGPGHKVVDWSLENDDAAKSFLKWNRQGPWSMHEELAAATSPDEVTKILAHYVGVGDVTTAPYTFKYNLTPSESRYAQQVPSEATFSYNDVNARVIQAERYLRNVGLDGDDVTDVLNLVGSARTKPEYYDAINNGVYGAVKRKLVEEGLSPKAADMLTEWGTDYKVASRYYDDMTSGTGEVMDAPFVQIDGNGKLLESPHLSSERLTREIPIVDYKSIRRAVKLNVTDEKALKDLAAWTRKHGQKLSRQGTPKAAEARGNLALADALDVMADDAAREFSAGAALENAYETGRGIPTGLREGGHVALDKAGAVWRASKLFRVAWGVRVVGEEQARMWAYGFTGALNDPFKALAIAVGADPDSKLGKLMKKMPGRWADPAYTLDANEQRFFEDAYEEALNRAPRFGGLDEAYAAGGPNAYASASLENWDWVPTRAANIDGGMVGNRALGEEMARLSQAPELRYAVDHSPAELKAWFRDDPTGKDVWRRLAEDDTIAHAAPVPDGPAFKPLGEMTEAELDAVMDFQIHTIYDRLEQFTRGNTKVRRALADRAIDGERLPSVASKRADKRMIELVRRLRVDEGWDAPAYVRARRDITVRADGPSPGNPIWRHHLNRMMYNLMPRPSNYLSRSPLFRQAYWNRMSEMLGAADPETKAKIIAAAKKANIDKKLIAQMELVVPISASPQTMSRLRLEGADRLAIEKRLLPAAKRDADEFQGMLDEVQGLAAKYDDEFQSILRVEADDEYRGWARIAERHQDELSPKTRDYLFNDAPGTDREATGFSREILGGEYRGAYDGMLHGSQMARLEEDVATRLDVIDNYNRSLNETVQETISAPALDFNTIDRVAKAHGLSETRRILYDLSERGQFFDLHRNILPFGEAWKEVLTRWARAIAENPKIVHRVAQGIEAGRGAGIIHHDGLIDQEVITFPFSEWITDKLLGVPVPFQGSLQGLNIAANGLPGIGPAVSIPLPYYMEALSWGAESAGVSDVEVPGLGSLGELFNMNNPKYKDIMQVIYPFGQPEATKGPISDVANALAPTWLGHMLNAAVGVDDQRKRSAVNYLLNYGASTGDFDLHNEDPAVAQAENQRLADWALSKARWVNLFRGALSGVAPTAPIPKWLIRDPLNKLQELQQIRTMYEERAQDDPDAAFEWLMTNWGEDNFLIAQSFTKSRSVRPRTKEGWEFTYAHPWLEKKYPETFGLIVPEDPEGEFDITGYWSYRNANEADIQNLSPRDRLDLANERLGRWLYDKVSAAAGPNPNDEQQALLDDFHLQLQDEYPGYSDQSPDFNSINRRIGEIELMVSDPEVLANKDMGPTARAVDSYLEVRQAVLNRQAKLGLTRRSISTSDKAAELRQVLRTYAEELIAQQEGFAAFWNNVLRRELKEPK